MAYTVNGIRIINGTLSIPRVGRPVFSGVLEDTTGPKRNEAATIDLDGAKFVGTIQWAAQEAKEWWNIRWVGGKNNIGKDYKQKFYGGLSLGELVKDRVISIGEEYQPSPVGSDIGAYVKRIVIPAGPGWLQIEQMLIPYPTLVWRILPNGKLTVIRDTFPEYKTPSLRIDYDPKIRLLILEEDFSLLPGVTLVGYTNVERVTHYIGKISKTEVSFGPG
jgi:hypothetical protein